MSDRDSLPAPDGPRPIGLQVLELTGNGRRIQAYAWYPASGTTEPPRAFMTEREAEAHALAARALGAAKPDRTLLTRLLTRTVCDAPVAPGTFPVVVFNHGGGLSPLANFSLMEAIASLGMVAISIGHAGESAALAWRDGSLTLIEPVVLTRMQLPTEALAAFARFLSGADEAARRRDLAVFRDLDPGGLGALSQAWASDSIAVVDHLLADPGSTPSPELSLALDRGKLAYGGMSLGGSAAFDCCRRDPRAVAGFNLDGVNWDFGAVDADIGIPFLDLASDPERRRAQLMSLAPDCTTQAGSIGGPNDFHYATAESRAAMADSYRLHVSGADHLDFTDLILLAQWSAHEDAEEAEAKRRTIVQTTCRFLQWAFGLMSRDEMDTGVANARLLVPVTI